MAGRRIRIISGLILLLISLALLIWGFWPAARQTRVLPIPPGDLTLPTPSSFLPACFVLAQNNLAPLA